jgi:hypothetical protein
MMTFGGAPFGAKSGSVRPDGPSVSRIRRAVVASTAALALFLSLGTSIPSGTSAFADDSDVVTPAQTQPTEDDQSTADAKKDDASVDDPAIEEQSAEPAEEAETKAVQMPRLVWEARDKDDKLFEGVTFELQGPRDDAKSGDDQWKEASKVTVEDNAGQRGYDGLDDDPTPGAFLVAQLDDDTAIDDGATYRVIPTAPESILTGDDAEWAKVEATTSNDDDPVVSTVKPNTQPVAEPAKGETPATEKSPDPVETSEVTRAGN